ncbi:GNAT family N-acetyltransferase [Salinicoccus hispanicus]|uniref:GNAT family N-acetyltransferase n=2 Tax=Salinicoccus hispanicus TaxID=157225 RepID=A0A6N8U298_9STAP|nr:GNAT family N-acetyltransferase [Salinicoccus hispanicus]
MKDIDQFLNLLINLETRSETGLHEAHILNASYTEALLTSVLQNAKRQIFIALDQQEMMGYISLSGNQGEMIKHRANISLGILPTDQQNSIGRNLLNSGIVWAEDNGIHRLELSIRDDFEVMIELYKALGFLKEGERIDALLIDDDYRNEIYLYRLINQKNGG